MRGAIIDRRNAGTHVELVVDGVAASAATLLVMGVDVADTRMQAVSEMMIHRASTGMYGNALEFQRTAEWLAKTDTAAADLYAARLGMTPDAALELMSAETWYSAQEAVAAGLAGGIVALQANAPDSAGEDDDHPMAGATDQAGGDEPDPGMTVGRQRRNRLAALARLG